MKPQKKWAIVTNRGKVVNVYDTKITAGYYCSVEKDDIVKQVEIREVKRESNSSKR